MADEKERKPYEQLGGVTALPHDYSPEDLPEQGGGYVPMLQPGTRWFRLPVNIREGWSDYEEKEADGQVKKDPAGNSITHLRLAFDDKVPLTVASGDDTDYVLRTGVSTQARKRGKDAYVSDAMYLLRIGCGDRTPLRTEKDLADAINKHAGELVVLETGARATCRDDVPRYIETVDPQTGRAKSIEDPAKLPGCGQRYYTRDIPRDAEGKYLERFPCKKCGASLRVFPDIERFHPKPQGA